MNREYSSGSSDKAIFFYGTEVEHSPAHNMSTLFVVGAHPIQTILDQIRYYNNVPKITHIYCGANQSFCPKDTNEWKEWEEMIYALLKKDFWVTLDFDVRYAEDLLETALCEHRKFIPMISIKLPYANQFNYNTTIKVDDKDFEASNPGVWCHSLHDLMDTSKFTSWDKYKDDKIL
jgi:hypothetical protein